MDPGLRSSGPGMTGRMLHIIGINGTRPVMTGEGCRSFLSKSLRRVGLGRTWMAGLIPGRIPEIPVFPAQTALSLRAWPAILPTSEPSS